MTGPEALGCASSNHRRSAAAIEIPERTPRGKDLGPADYETDDLERGAYITAVVHLYRGEVARANTWRQRLDQTTNWAIFTTASALGFAYGDLHASHFSLQFANILLFVLLILEARRFRFFDVWRARIRKIETNFFAPILKRQLTSPETEWAIQVADDLNTPHFHVTRLQALRLRLLRNYVAIYAVIFVAWSIKLVDHPTQAGSWEEVYDRCAVGSLPGWLPLSLIGVFYVCLAVIIIAGKSLARSPGLDNWDIGEIVREEARRR